MPKLKNREFSHFYPAFIGNYPDHPGNPQIAESVALISSIRSRLIKMNASLHYFALWIGIKRSLPYPSTDGAHHSAASGRPSSWLVRQQTARWNLFPEGY